MCDIHAFWKTSGILHKSQSSSDFLRVTDLGILFPYWWSVSLKDRLYEPKVRDTFINNIYQLRLKYYCPLPSLITVSNISVGT